MKNRIKWSTHSWDPLTGLRYIEDGEFYVESLVFPRSANKTAHTGLRSRIRAPIPRGLKRIWSFTNGTEDNLGLCRNVHRIAQRNADLIHSPTHVHGVKTQLDGSTLVLMQVVRQAKLYSGFIASRLHSQRSVPAGTQRPFSAVSLTVHLKHCNVARVFGCSRLGLQPVIVTEFLVRGQLDQLLDKLLQQPMNLSEITVGENGEIFAEFPIDLLVQTLLDITSRLEYLFYEGFVYGHLTSAMILLSSELRCKLRILFHPVAPTHTSELLRYEQAMQEDRISDETNNGRSVVAGTNPFLTKIVNSWKEANSVDAEQQNSACSPMSTGLTLNNQRTVCFEERKLTPSHQYASRTSAEPQTRMAHGMMTCPCEHIHLKDSPIGIFHSVIHALDTRQPNYPAEGLGITFGYPDRSRTLNIEDELKFQDLWCLGGIMAELIIAHVLLSDNERTRVYQLCEVEPHPPSDEVFQNTACIGHLLPASAKTLSPRYSNSRLRSIVPDYRETKECLLNPLTASSQCQFHTLQTEHPKKSAAVTCAPVEISLSGITTWDVFGEFVHLKFPDFDFHLILQRLRGSAPQHRPSISRIRRYFYEVYTMLSHKQMRMEATPNLHMKSCGTMRKSYVQWSDVSASLEV
ncbi:unnamed protein product [Calicophoron daubneyi]|uniref:Serine-threonine/tyrosine-protein kinase catalytic domain-containing protein n=1 Tax=Calicophoron daubneyi TaxID=300641 RepID=A0AAV2U0N1_CALDB